MLDVSTTDQLQRTLDAFDLANSQDPHVEIVDGREVPKEWIYGRRMSEQLSIFCPNASIPLQLSARCQHICRWKIPRDAYPMDRQGYKRWRSDLALFHSETAAKIMTESGYDGAMIDRVRDLLLKRGLKRDEEVQTLEDVICLVFLQYYLAEFAAKHEESKLIDIIQKTWNKMSEKGHNAALQLPLNNAMLQLITKALNAAG